MSRRTRNAVYLCAVTIGIAVSASPQPASAGTIVVCWDGAGDYVTIQEGIDAAVDGDEVVVCDGTYSGDGNRDLDFQGKHIAVRSAAGDPATCIIDCQGDPNDPHRGFFLHSGEIASLSGFTITNGYASDDGGGIYCKDAQVTITNCAISGNSAGGEYARGGGAHFEDAQVTISDCTITNNVATELGGGVCCRNAQVTITNCTITGNHAGGEGAGICCWYPSLTIAGCAISDNHVDFVGGGVFTWNANLAITDCTISSNTAGYSAGGVWSHDDGLTITRCTINGNGGYFGGGLYCDSNGTISNCTISDNEANCGGGAYCDGHTPTITNCTIANNSANGSNGGGITFTLDAVSPVVTNCLITGNTAAGSGGGLCCDSGAAADAVLTNCTFARNAAAHLGGAVHCDSDGMTTHLRLTNCILWADSAAEGAEIALRNSVELTALFSNVQGGEAAVYADGGAVLIWGAGNIDADPSFVDPDNSDFHLSPGSACVDAACNWGVPPDAADLDDDGDLSEITPLDLDGEGRFFDDPDTLDTGCGSSDIVDMGAYEFGGTGLQPCPGDINGDRVVDQSDLGILLSLWGNSDECDLNCDGIIDQADLGILLAHWGEGC